MKKKKWYVLYIPFWLNLYKNDNTLKNHYWTLHSILVKSIQNNSVAQSRSYILYIPFWLNLYKFPAKICEKIFWLYIPFWLNLYDSDCYTQPALKKLYIPFWLNLYSNFVYLQCSVDVLYIPFWLNLYEKRWKLAVFFRTLHSILVKSIRSDMLTISCLQ